MNQQQAMNRQQKRMLRKQGEIEADGTPTVRRYQPPPAPKERASPIQFLKEVHSELQKVAWPNRAETINYSVVVFVTVVLFTVMIYGLDWVLSTFVLELFEPPSDPYATSTQ